MTGFFMALIIGAAPSYAGDCASKFSDRRAPCTPTDADKAAILRRVEEAREAIADARQAEIAAKNMMQAAEQFPNDIYILEAWDETRKDAARKQVDAQDAARVAMKLTLETYGISEFYSTGSIQSGPYKSSTTTPIPLLSDNRDTYYRSTGMDGRAHYNGISKNPAGVVGGQTIQDGTVVIMSRVFDIASMAKSPRLLAASLHHEGVHFRQLTSGTGWSTKEEVEAAAYAASIAEADTFELSPDEKAGLVAQRNQYLAVPSSRRHPLHGEAVEAEAFQALTNPDSELNKIRRREQDLTAKLTKARLARDRQLASAVPSPETIHEISARNSWAKAYKGLAPLAERACRAGISGIDSDGDFSFEWFQWRDSNYRDIQLDSGLAHWPDLALLPGPVECSTFVINQVVAARRAGYDRSILTPSWLTEVVSESVRRTNPARPTPPGDAPKPPQMVIPGIDVPAEEDRLSPPIPHCRYHPWCKG